MSTTPIDRPALPSLPGLVAQPAAFIDRDGVINAELDYVFRPEDFHVLPGVVDALRLLAAHGFALVVVTNQAGIAKGRYDEAAYQRLTQHMRGLFAAQGIALAGVYHCPHHPQGTVAAYAHECDCRKPAPGMLLRAARELELDLKRSVLVGDKASDTEAGRAAGLRWTVLVESGHRLSADALQFADHRCADLAEAAAWLCQPERLAPSDRVPTGTP
jgi:D-glycero-D-manno-heptose 1,7-bisphosphate phosphatase